MANYDSETGVSLNVAPANLRIEVWRTDNDEQDFLAAGSFLTLGAGRKDGKRVLRDLRRVGVDRHPATEVLRMAGLPMLGLDDPIVKRQLMNVVLGNRLSPILAIRGDIDEGLPLVIVNGYHRLCAGYYVREAESVPVRVADR